MDFASHSFAWIMICTLFLSSGDICYSYNNPVVGSLIVAPKGSEVQVKCDPRTTVWSYSNEVDGSYQPEQLQPDSLGGPTVEMNINTDYPYIARIRGLVSTNTGDVLQCVDHHGPSRTFLFFVHEKPWTCSICGSEEILVITCQNEFDAGLLEMLRFDMQHSTAESSNVPVEDTFLQKEGNKVLLAHTIPYKGRFSQLTTNILVAYTGWSADYSSDWTTWYQFLHKDSRGYSEHQVVELSVGESCGIIFKQNY